MYTGKACELPEWDMISEFRLIISETPNLFEIHVLKVKNKSDTELIENLVTKRAELINNFRKTVSSFFTSSEAVVFTKGNYVFFIATPYNDKIIDKINKII